jgi:hypothetical protein
MNGYLKGSYINVGWHNATGFTWLRTGSINGLLWSIELHINLCRTWSLSWLRNWLLVSQEGIRLLELVIETGKYAQPFFPCPDFPLEGHPVPQALFLSPCAPTTQHRRGGQIMTSSRMQTIDQVISAIWSRVCTWWNFYCPYKATPQSSRRYRKRRRNIKCAVNRDHKTEETVKQVPYTVAVTHRRNYVLRYQSETWRGEKQKRMSSDSLRLESIVK